MFETIAVFLPLAGACIAGMLAFARPDDKKKQGRIDAAAQWALTEMPPGKPVASALTQP